MNKIKLYYFSVLMFVWIILTWSVNPYQLLLGATACMLVTLFTSGLIPASIQPFTKPAAILILLRYACLLAADMLKTNIIIAGRLLRQPASTETTMTFQSTLTNPLALTLLANAISLIYDTAVVTMAARTGTLLIHCTATEIRGESPVRLRIEK